MIRTMPGLRALDDDFNELPEWEAIKSRRSETPVLSEGLIYLDVRRDAGDFEDYPSGFYDVHLNQVIDLSQYNIQSIYEDEPRFINGYAVLQMKNPEGVPFWGVIKRDGTWAAEPQKVQSDMYTRQLMVFLLLPAKKIRSSGIHMTKPGRSLMNGIE